MVFNLNQVDNITPADDLMPQTMAPIDLVAPIGEPYLILT